MGDQGSGEGDSGVQAVAVAECRYGGAGNEALHALTAGTPTELRVDLRTPQDAAFAHYRDFTVAGPEDHYRLHLGAYSGTAGIGGLGGVLGGLGGSWRGLGRFLSGLGGSWRSPGGSWRGLGAVLSGAGGGLGGS